MKFLYSKVPELLSQSVVALAVKLTGVLVGFLTNVFLARSIGASGSGAYYFALTAVTFCAAIGSMGCENVILKFVAVNWAEGKSRKVYTAVKHVFVRSAISAGMLVAVLILVSQAMKGVVDEELHRLLSITLFVVPFMSVCLLIGGVLRGFSKVVFAVAVPNTIPQLMTLGLLALLVPLYGSEGAAYSLFFAYISVSLIALIIIKLKSSKLSPLKGEGFTEKEKKQINNSGFQLLTFNVVLQINQWFSVIFLGFIAAPSVVGTYTAAAKTASLMSLLLVAINTVVAPKLAKLYACDNKMGMAILLRKATFLVVAASSLPFVLIMFYPQWVMSLFGEDFVEASTALQIIAIGQIFNALTGPVGAALLMSGNEKNLRNSAILSAMLCVILNILLVPKMGGLGAAIATSICIATMSIYAWIAVRIKIGIIVYPSFR